jgi:tRNA U34 5-methylaminomethyl-2-thiouridine-forming methyltransferase MnmC
MADSSSDSVSPLIVTGDGSHTVYSEHFDQHYHNPNGAVTESRYVFFEQTGLSKNLNTRDRITILEIGFGTGLNLLLLIDYYLSQDATAQIQFYSIEGFPLDKEVVENFNYGKHLRHPEFISKLTEIFDNLTAGMNHFKITDNISLQLFKGMFEDFNPAQNELNANYIFHDAFSPDVNPDLWSGKVFKTIRDFSADDVILSTYSAASKAQGALAWAGWHVAKTKGALGKREMILAALDSSQLKDLKQINEKRYAQRYEKGDFD